MSNPELSSSLHTKLQNLDLEFLHGVPVHLTDEMIAQIKTAFQEAGYRQVPKQSEIQHLIDDGTMTPLMTGQEFYTRFKAEYAKLHDPYAPEADDSDFWEAAHRAAGLES